MVDLNANTLDVYKRSEFCYDSGAVGKGRLPEVGVTGQILRATFPLSQLPNEEEFVKLWRIDDLVGSEGEAVDDDEQKA